MRVILRVLVGATIVADTIGLVLYGAVMRLQGDTILNDALVISGAIAFAVMLILALAAIESRGRPRRQRAAAKTAASTVRIATLPLRPIRPNVIGASEAPAAAPPIAKAPLPAPVVPAPVVPTPVVAARSVSAPAPSATPALVPAARIALTNVRPAPALATRLAQAPTIASRIAPAPPLPSEIVQGSPTATEMVPVPAFAPETIAAPAISPEPEWIIPAGLDAPDEPQSFFELLAMVREEIVKDVPKLETATPEPANVERPAEIASVEATDDADLALWRAGAVSLVAAPAAPPATESETRIPELDAIVRALDVLRAAEAQEPPRLVVIPGGKTWRSAS